MPLFNVKTLINLKYRIKFMQHSGQVKHKDLSEHPQFCKFRRSSLFFVIRVTIKTEFKGFRRLVSEELHVFGAVRIMAAGA